MELEFYDEEKHDYFLEIYRKHSRSPTGQEKQFFRPLIEELVEEISEETGISSDFKLYFAITDESSLSDRLTINRYVKGFSYANFMEGFDLDVIMIRAVRDRKNWKACLINMLAHEMAHQQYYNITKNSPYKIWENLLFEGHAMNTAEKATEKLGTDWKPHYRSDKQIEINSRVIADLLDKNRVYDSEDIFCNGERPCPKAEGYNISYQLVKNISENESINADKLLKIPEEELKELISTNLSNILK